MYLTYVKGPEGEGRGGERGGRFARATAEALVELACHVWPRVHPRAAAGTANVCERAMCVRARLCVSTCGLDFYLSQIMNHVPFGCFICVGLLQDGSAQSVKGVHGP